MNYIEIISKNHPTVGCSIQGDPSVYENIVWSNPETSIPKATLDALWVDTCRSEKWEEIKKYRDERKFKGIYVSQKWFHNDADSRTQWLGLKDKARDIINNGGNANSVLTITHQRMVLSPYSGTRWMGV